MQRLSRGQVFRLANEHGVAAVIVAIVLVPVLLAGAAFSVDLARIDAEAQQLQRAVDAGALAGAVLLPTNPVAAQEAGVELTRMNLATGTQVDITTTVVADQPAQLSVTGTRKLDHHFASLLGVGPTTISKTAQADYAPPLALGSPCNVFGNENMPPQGGGVGQNPVAGPACPEATQMWANAGGPLLNKSFGDAFASQWCVWSVPGTPTAGCSPVGAGPTPPGENLEYRAGGYSYLVRVKQPGRLRLQGYDLVWASTGPQCLGVTNPADPSTLVNPLVGANLVLSNEFVDVRPEPSNQRYAAGPSSYCSGDDQQPYPWADASAAALEMSTTFAVHQPGVSPWQPGSLLCQPVSAPGFNALDTNYAQLLTTNAGGERGEALRRMFHRWVDLCPGLNVTPGDYIIKVTTSNGAGNNRFALRGWLEDAVDPTALAIVAHQSMVPYSNIPAGTSRFHLVRLASTTAGRTLIVKAFDLGDAAGNITVRLIDQHTGQPLASCQVDGPMVVNPGNCGLVANYESNNGQWNSFTIPIAADYRCQDDTDMQQCWILAEVTTPTQIYDTTTWTAHMDGHPVRLVE